MNKGKIARIASVIGAWILSSGVGAYILINIVLPLDKIPKSMAALNQSGKFDEALGLAARIQRYMPIGIRGAVESNINIEKAKANLGLGNYETALDILKTIDTLNLDNRTRNEFYLTRTSTSLNAAQRAYNQSDMTSYIGFAKAAQQSFSRIDNPEMLGSAAMLIQMDVQNNNGNAAIEENPGAQGVASAYYVKARKVPSGYKNTKDLQIIDEYIEAINGETRLMTEARNASTMSSAIDNLLFVNKIAEDFGLQEHLRYSSHELGVAYYQQEKFDLAELWLTKTEKITEKQLEENGVTTDQRSWIIANKTATQQALASLYLRIGKTEVAINLLKQILQNSTNTQIGTTVNLKLAQAYIIDASFRDLNLAYGYLNAASNLINSNVGRSFDRPAISLWFGHLEYLRGNFENAKKRYSEAAKQYEEISQTASKDYQSAINGFNGKRPVFISNRQHP